MKFILTLLSAFVLIFSACKPSGDVKEPEFRDIGNVRLIETGLLKTTVGANMIYYNPNNFGIKLSAARGDVYVENAYFGSFVLDQEIQVKKSAEFELPVTIKIDNIGAIKNNTEIYKKKEVLVRIEGRAVVKKSGISKEVPIRYEQKQDIDKIRALVAR
ncbi:MULTISPECIES: LEA type 2 family protein [Niastella]|uniref:LEA type 2 family protein n=1 Tax=Niastella soli TaxID=2821487 RepID=A0ABS3YW09_9BACT|nr:LEA type 2 family protein [Niastella soli]MBO9202100.1 LEA type 2 family protein [Niastella soli]